MDKQSPKLKTVGTNHSPMAQLQRYYCQTTIKIRLWIDEYIQQEVI